MELNLIIEKKQHLAKQIRQLIKTFEEETHVLVDDVILQHTSFEVNSHIWSESKIHYILNNVHVSVKLEP